MAAAPHILYRRIGALDVALARALMRVFGEAFEDAETYHAAPPGDAYLQRLLASDHFIALVATEAGHVVGGLTAYVLDKPEQERREIYIYDLAVAAPHRRRGVATRLIGTLGEIAAERDAYVIFVQADLVDAPAIALYDKLGVKETAHHFDIAVARRRSPRPGT